MGRRANSESSRGKVAAATQHEALQPVDADAAEGVAESGDPSHAIGPEAQARLAEIRARLETSVGQIVLLMMQLPRYRHQALADLNHLVIEPLLRDRVAIAFAKVKRVDEAKIGQAATVGAAIWASVNNEIDLKIREQVKSDSFPIRLKPDEWACGETVWLLDIVAQSRKSASAVLANFRNVAGTGKIRIHPLVGQLVDPELLNALQRR